MANIVEFKLTNEAHEGYNQDIGFCKYCRRYVPKSYFVGCYGKMCKTCVKCREKHLTYILYGKTSKHLSEQNLNSESS